MPGGAGGALREAVQHFTSLHKPNPGHLLSSLSCPTHIAHAEVALELAEEVVDENGAVLLDAQQVLAGRPAQLHQLAALPLWAGDT